MVSEKRKVLSFVEWIGFLKIKNHHILYYRVDGFLKKKLISLILWGGLVSEKKVLKFYIIGWIGF